MLFMTSFVAVVGAGDQPSRSPRRLQIINTKNHSIICEQNFVTAILCLKLNKKRYVHSKLTMGKKEKRSGYIYR
jgi:autophagy-related protein 18